MARVINSQQDIDNFITMLKEAFATGKYEVIQGIHQGALASVIAVHDIQPGRPPALLPLAMLLYDNQIVRFSPRRKRKAIQVVTEAQLKAAKENG